MSKTDTVIKNSFFNSTFRNEQLELLARQIGTINVIKSSYYDNEKPFIYNKDKTRHVIEYDPTLDVVIGIPDFAQTLSEDKSSDNYKIDLSDIRINGQRKVLFILDLDKHVDKKSGKTTDGIAIFKEKYLKQFGFPDSLRVRTKRNGFHLYFYTSPEVMRDLGFNKKDAFDVGIDLKSTQALKGNHCVPGPGSQQHDKENDARLSYKIENAIPIAPLPDKFIQYLKEVYEKVNRERREAMTAAEKAQKDNIPVDLPKNIKRGHEYVTRKVNEARDLRVANPGHDPHLHSRNDTLNGHAYRLASFGLSKKVVVGLGMTLNKELFESPLDEDEVLLIVGSAYASRVEQGESSANAAPSIPEFPKYPSTDKYGKRVVKYSEIIDRLEAAGTMELEELAKHEEGVQLMADWIVNVEGNMIIVKKNPLQKTLDGVNRLLSQKEATVSPYDILRELKKSEISFQTFHNIPKFDSHIGEALCVRESSSVKPDGTPKAGRITTVLSKHDVFNSRHIKGLSSDTSYPPSGNIIEDGVFHMAAPPPIAAFPRLTPDQMKEAVPKIVEPVLAFFLNNLTDPTETDEAHFLKNRIAAMVQRKHIHNMLVIHGPGGTGKSSFLNFLSLMFSSTDVAQAHTLDSMTKQFFALGELTLIDDCDFNAKMNWPHLKTLITSESQRLEEKYERAKTVNKTVSIIACTNVKITNTELLNDRRTYIVSGMLNNRDTPYVDLLDEQMRLLLENDLLGLRAVYQYFCDFNITITNWDQSSKTQNAMRTAVINEKRLLGGANQAALSEGLMQKEENRKLKTLSIVMNTIVNFGYPHLDCGLEPCKFRITTAPITKRQKEFIISCTYDNLLALHYFDSLSSDTFLTARAFFEETCATPKVKQDALSNFTHSLNNMHDPFSNVVGKDLLISEVSKKISSKDKYNRARIGQTRTLILPPISLWIPGVSYLTSGTLSKSNSEGVFEAYGMTDIIIQINAWEEEGHNPSKQECEDCLHESFPDAILGKFDVISETENMHKEFEFAADKDKEPGNWD